MMVKENRGLHACLREGLIDFTIITMFVLIVRRKLNFKAEHQRFN